MSAKVVMYSTRFCPYCMLARRLFKGKGVDFEEIKVGGDSQLWAEMEERSGGSTVPQIFINSKPVGGYDDIAILNLSDELDKLLEI